MVSVWEKGGDQKEYRHSGAEKDGCSVVVILIVQSQVQDNCRYVDKPQELRNDENLVKRNIVVNRHMDYLIFPYMSLLQPGEPGHIYEEV